MLILLNLFSFSLVLLATGRTSPEQMKKSFHDMNKEEQDEALSDIFSKIDSNKDHQVTMQGGHLDILLDNLK